MRECNVCGKGLSKRGTHTIPLGNGETVSGVYCKNCKMEFLDKNMSRNLAIDFIVRKVSGKDCWVGGQNFKWLWCVVKANTAMEDYDCYFDIEADANRFANKMNGVVL
jgi:hypothetical protein